MDEIIQGSIFSVKQATKKKCLAVVTGATRGIGYAIAERLLADGLQVITTGTTQNGTYPTGAMYQPVDFLNDDSTDAFIFFLKKQPVDILVNNAGINKINKFTDIKTEDFDQILKVNLKTPFLLCQAVLPYMQANKWGRIINITSIFGNITKKYRASYSSSKFGLDGMTAALAAEVAEFGILANCVGPGFIDTDLTRRLLKKDEILTLQNQIPMKSLGKEYEIASLVSWLASSENTYMTGQNLIMDGGFSRV